MKPQLEEARNVDEHDICCVNANLSWCIRNNMKELPTHTAKLIYFLGMFVLFSSTNV